MSAARPIWPKVAAGFVRESLTGHKILGLALAGLLYLVCLSGTATVFFIDTQRWESPRLPDLASASPRAVAAAIEDSRRAVAGAKDQSLSVYVPTPDNPRLTVQAGGEARAYDGQGRYAGAADHPVTDALTELHYQLHLPSSLGLLVVGLTGIGMTALVAGGLLAHPRIFRDAFLWRRGAGARLNRSDLHNRIAVWGLPFHLAIALTGAVIGVASPLLLIAAVALHHGDTAAAARPLFGPDAVSGEAHGRMSAEAVMRVLAAPGRLKPGAQPSYISINQAGTGRESITLTADLPDRLVYGETWEFDGTGRLRAAHRLADGPAGKQIYASLYKLHFGSFGGVWVRWAYFVLGLGLCMVCTTGMDIWLLKSAARGRPYPRLRQGWTGFVWAAPAAMALAAVLTLIAGAPFRPVFWGGLALATAAAALAPSQRLASLAGRLGLGLLLLLLAAAHVLRFGAAALSPAGWPTELALLAGGLVLLAAALAPDDKIFMRRSG
jgi:uncharacterized iron-regulated membrane protein